MSNESDVYGFMASLDGDHLAIADGMGGGTFADVYHRDDAIQAIEAYVHRLARSVAEAIVDELDFPEDEDGEDFVAGEAS